MALICGMIILELKYLIKYVAHMVDCMLPEVQVTAGLGFFLHLSHLCDNEDCDSLL